MTRCPECESDLELDGYELDVGETLHCPECSAEVGMMSVDSTARESGISELAIYKLVETRALHFTEDAEGRVLVCLNSLRRWPGPTET